MTVDRKEMLEMLLEGKLFHLGPWFLLTKKTSVTKLLELLWHGIIDDGKDGIQALQELASRLRTFGWRHGYQYFDGLTYEIFRANDSDTAIIFWFDYNSRAGFFVAVQYPFEFVFPEVQLS